jgi:biotin transport system substrate-specific component
MEKQRILTLRSAVIEQSSTIVQALWIAFFAIGTAIGAQIELYHHPVPYTMQTFFVLLSGAVLGKRNGALSQLLYLAAGVIGLPVFASWGFGAARLIGPTGGYLLSFPIAAWVIGYLVEQRKNYFWMLLSMIIGLFIVFTLGTVYLNGIYFHDWSNSLISGLMIFSWWDGVKLIAAAGIAYRFRK